VITLAWYLNILLLIGIELATNNETRYGVPLSKLSFAPAG